MKIRSCYGHRGRAAPVYSVVLWVVRLDDGWGYGYVFRMGYIFRLGIRPCFRHLRVAFVGRMLLRPYTRYMPYMKIRPCFSNREYVSVRDTETFFERGTRYPSKFERVFQIGYTLPIKIRTCFPNRIHIIHQNTETFSEPGTRYPSKCGNIFRTGHKRSIEMRTCFPN